MITTISSLRTFNQLKWISFRIDKIISSAQSHFGRKKVQEIIESIGPSPVSSDSKLENILDEKDLNDFILHLSKKIQIHEAKIVTALYSQASVYQSHVQDQILFGASIAGQEAARISTSQSHDMTWPQNIPEIAKIVMLLTYNGEFNTRNYFVSYRRFGASSIHFSESAHLNDWLAGGGDPNFLYKVKMSWVQGILDVLDPRAKLVIHSTIENGDKFGLIHLLSTEKNVSTSTN